MNGNGKPKNFSQALNELENATDSDGSDFRGRLQAELNNIEATLSKIKPHLNDIKDRVGTEAKKAKETVEDQVQKNPWAAIGIVGLIFFVLGFLLRGSRRGD